MKNKIEKTNTSDNSDRENQTVTNCDRDGHSSTRESDLSSGRFSARLVEAKGKESVRQFASRAGLSEKVVRQYLNGESDPSRLFLARMARALGVNLGWLATGEGPMKTGQQVTDERATYTPERRDLLDMERLEEAIRAVEAYLEKQGVARPPEVKAELVAYFYDRSLRKDRVEKTDLVRLLDLIY